MKAAILTKARHHALVREVLPEAHLAESLSDLPGRFDILIGYGTGVIVPEPILLSVEAAFNFHAASPDYPGRDPHHWAAYDRATAYGATAHYMWPQVDAGPIVGTLLFSMPSGSGPEDYRERGEKAAALLFRALAPQLATRGANVMPIQWGKMKRARADLIRMCDFGGLDQAEIEKRKRAFIGFESYFRNLTPACLP